jgi:bifunctional UDP-N-acetylglucosamine pyrophosphorylase/glucosamine-1-phosphate N-acetyltransferase
VSIVGTPLIDDAVEIAAGAKVENGARLRGQSKVGADTLVDVGTVIQDSTIAEGTNIKPYCMLVDSQVGAGVQLGPFAHLRPGSVLEDDCHIGNFVETKKTLVKKGAKANHLAYLGDAEIGEKSNLGAGTIICNYDGFQKQRTVIGKGVFIGSDSQLVAPVNIGDRAYVATNTTVTEDVPAGALTIGRSRQVNKEGRGDQLRDRLSEEARAKKAKPKKPA